jgi:drug/metabolite transporter (DMT)-like permease
MNAVADNTLKGVAFAFATTFVGSAAGAAGKWVASDVAVPLIVFIQYAICLLVIAPRFLGKPLAALRTTRGGEHLIRGVGGWLCFYTYYASLAEIPLVDATLLRNTAPLFVPLVALIWLNARVPLLRWIPLVLGFIGVVFILPPAAEKVGWGHFFGLMSGLTLAVSMVGTRTLSRTDSGKNIMFYYFLVSFLLSLPLAIVHWQPIPWKAWPYLIFIGLSIFIAMWLYTKAFSYAKASVVSPINYFSVVVSGVLGWFIWDYLPTDAAVFGALMIVGAGGLSIYLASREEKIIKR